MISVTYTSGKPYNWTHRTRDNNVQWLLLLMMLMMKGEKQSLTFTGFDIRTLKIRRNIPWIDESAIHGHEIRVAAVLFLGLCVPRAVATGDTSL